jgi:hypothetical protein
MIFPVEVAISPEVWSSEVITWPMHQERPVAPGIIHQTRLRGNLPTAANFVSRIVKSDIDITPLLHHIFIRRKMQLFSVLKKTPDTNN